MPTKRTFDTIIIVALSLRLMWGGLVRPWGRRWASQKTGWQQVAGEAAARAA